MKYELEKKENGIYEATLTTKTKKNLTFQVLERDMLHVMWLKKHTAQAHL
ncbi:MAG: hypothetical protein MJ149_02020 [Clostridia bacterium]|nr:hypothetical protein [Clostridia bacterium]